MGAARVEIYKKGRGSSGYPGSIRTGMPVLVDTETTSTTATTAGDRITAPEGNATQMFASIVVDEDCYVAIGADPTATATNSYLIKANVARELPIRGGEKISFKDVA